MFGVLSDAFYQEVPFYTQKKKPSSVIYYLTMAKYQLNDNVFGVEFDDDHFGRIKKFLSCLLHFEIVDL